MTHKHPRNGVESLLKVMQALRGPGGCPWDLQQTPESLTPYILEEACELIDAIEAGSTEHILDELGDLLMQVVFMAQIFNERQQFDFDDVAAGIADKLVRRHPHVFNPEQAAAALAELDQQWDAIKRAEATHNKTCMADHLPSKLPALQRAQKLISRAYRAERQADLPDVDPNLPAKLHRASGDNPGLLDEDTLGQALFHLVRLARNANLDAESALRKTTSRVTHHIDAK